MKTFGYILLSCALIAVLLTPADDCQYWFMAFWMSKIVAAVLAWLGSWLVKESSKCI